MAAVIMRSLFLVLSILQVILVAQAFTSPSVGGQTSRRAVTTSTNYVDTLGNLEDISGANHLMSGLDEYEDEDDDDDLDDLDDEEFYENPMWPIGVSKDDIDILVKDILSDVSINLPPLPDVLERQVYMSTILLTLNAVYRVVGDVHGKRLWGHTFVLSRERCDDLAAKNRQRSLLDMKTDVDEELLEEVAGQLLRNTAINQPLVPDFIERQLYVNCLKIIFRILNMLAASFRINLCGHDLKLTLERAQQPNVESLKKIAVEAVSSPTPIDRDVLQKLARGKVFSKTAGTNSTGGAIWKRGQQEFAVQINTVLYSMILGILDDLLANTELELMTDRISVDIVGPKDLTKKMPQRGRKNKKKQRQPQQQAQQSQGEEEEGPPKKRRKLPILTFVFGTVFGLATGRFLF